MLKDLADQLIAGKITLAEWQMQMREFIRVTHRMAAVAACGGMQNMTPANWGYLGYLVKLQYRYLDQFAADIAANPNAWLNGRLLIRMQLYQKAEWGTFEQMLRFLKRKEGFTEERRVLGEADHCPGCLEQSSRSWQSIGTLDPIGAEQCATNCRCVFHYRRSNGSGGFIFEYGN